MKRLRSGGAIFALFLAAGASFADDTATKGAAALEGIWRFLSWEDQGEKAPASAIKNFRWTFRGNEAVWSSGHIPERNLTREEKYTIEVDPSKSPKWIDLTPIEAKGKAPVLGIYEVEDGKLKLCMPSDPKKGGRDRPSKFQARRGSGLMLMVLERVKDK